MSSDSAPPRALRFARVGTIAGIPRGTGRAFTVGRYEVAVFNVDGRLYAAENACPHQGGPIAEGTLEGPYVTCPWHAWCFNVTDGKMSLGDFATLVRFDVRLEGDEIFIATEPEVT